MLKAVLSKPCVTGASDPNPTATGLKIMTKTEQLLHHLVPPPSDSEAREPSLTTCPDVAVRQPEGVKMRIDGASLDASTSGSSAGYGFLKTPYKSIE